MRRAWLIGLTTIALGASAGTCDVQQDPRQPGHDPGANAPAADPIVELYANVPDRCSPYKVRIKIEGGQGLNPDQTIPVASGKYENQFVYKTGKRLTVTFSILDAKPNCVIRHDEIQVMGCKITDGQFGSGFKPLVGATGMVVCTHTTRR